MQKAKCIITIIFFMSLNFQMFEQVKEIKK